MLKIKKAIKTNTVLILITAKHGKFLHSIESYVILK